MATALFSGLGLCPQPSMIVRTKGFGICFKYRKGVHRRWEIADKEGEMSFLLAGLFERLTKSGREALIKDTEDPRGRRRHPRRQVNSSALFQWSGEEDQDHAECVYIADVSAGGCRLVLPHAIDSGWPVLITPQGKPPLKGIVRHRRAVSGQWSVGVQLIRNDRRYAERHPMFCPASLRWH